MPDDSKNELAPKPLKIFIHSMDGQGHLSACVGLGQACAKRGHRVIFLVNSVFAGQFAKFGFEEILLYRNESKSVNDVPEDPVKGFAEQLLKSGFLSGLSSLEKLKSFNPTNKADNFVQTLFDSTVDFNPQIGAAIEREQPDAFILDHFLGPPVVFQLTDIPYMFLYSGNPLSLYKSDKLPPFASGYPTDSDPSTWTEFVEAQKTHFLKTFNDFQRELNRLFNYEPPEGEEVEAFVVRSKWLNIYQYPEELDYQDITPIGEEYARVDAFLRDVPEHFQLPEEFVSRPGKKMIYVSLGSMGSIDVQLMKRIVSVLAKTPHKYIVSKGPLGNEYELPANCWGENFLPQTKILPLVDLVITHGGNNTTTETFCFGKPQIVLPLFGDQYDNAQRLSEKGYGIRLETYSFTDQELVDAIEKLLNDTEMQQRLKAAAQRIATDRKSVV